jgi:hypothetical protein
MTNRLFFFLLIFMLASSSFFAQENGIRWSDPIDKFHPDYPIVVGCNDEHVFLSQITNEAKKERKILYLNSRNFEHKGLKNLPDLEDGFEHEYIFPWEKTILFLSTAYDAASKKLSYLIETVEDSAIVSKKYHFETDIRLTPISRIFAATNKAQNKLAIFRLEQKDVSNPPKLHILIVDNQLDTIKNSTVLLPANNYLQEKLTSLLDNDGNLHILFPYKDSNISRYKIFAFPVLNDDIVEYSIDLPEKNILGINFSLNENEELVTSGIYASEKINPEKAIGVFYFRIDRESGEIASKNIQEFNYNIEPLAIPSGVGVKRKDFQGFVVKKVESNYAGETTMFAEQSFTEQICVNDFRTGTIVCNDVTISGEILIVKFSNSGDVLWFDKISKQQETFDEDRKFAGFSTFISKGKILFLYNDNKKNKSGRKGDIIEFASGKLHKGGIRFAQINTSDPENKTNFIDQKGLLIPDLQQSDCHENKSYYILQQKNQFRLLIVTDEVFQ